VSEGDLEKEGKEREGVGGRKGMSTEEGIDLGNSRR
jgi:hypothetical protein